MKKAMIVIAAVAVLCLTGGGSALAVTTTLTLTGTYNDLYSYNNVLAGPYQFTVGSTSGVALICDTYQNEIYMNETWTANVIQGNAVTSTNTLLPIGTQAYDEIFWLVEQMNATTNQSTIQDIQYAIWTIGDPGSTPPVGTDTDMIWVNGKLVNAVTYWLSQAAADWSTVDAADFVVYVPVAGSQPKGDGMPQEFIEYVPEPSSLLFLGISLLMIAGAVSLKVSKTHI
jgi:hypothetical protein